ncbi:MAG: Ig-like domain-containing protein [Clostridiales bacterium]|nr:Ig-like domain-containing protein [Clostridiales bacterium]
MAYQKRNKQLLLLLLALFSTLAVLFSNDTVCLAANQAYDYVYNSSETPIESGTYQVTFRPNGGYFLDSQGFSHSMYILYNIYSGTKVASQDLPDSPIRSGYWFRGWYTDSLCTKKFDVENVKITSNISLYAKWEQKNILHPNQLSSTYTYDGKRYDITVDMTNQTFGSAASLTTGTIPVQKVLTAAQSVTNSNHYFAFSYGINDCSIGGTPISVTIKLPDGFSKDKVAVYYLTDHTDQLLISEGHMESGTNNTAGQYTFLTFQQGAFLVVDTTKTSTPSGSTSSPSPYISLAGDDVIKINTTSDLQVILHNFDALIDSYLDGEESTLEDADLECFDYKWTSSNSSVASVSGNGCAVQIQAKKQGTVTIKCSCYYNGNEKIFTATKTISIKKNPPKKITLNATKKTLKKGSSFQIKASFTPTNCSNQSVTYRSTKPFIAAVSSSGKVTAKKKGTCYIYVRCKKYPGIYKRCKITVK